MRHRPLQPSLLAALALLALHLPACGGGGGAGGGAAPCSATPQAVTAGGAWQAYAPQTWTSCTLEVKVPALAADERLAVLVVNASGSEHVAASDPPTATLSISGTGAAVEAPGAAPLLRAAGTWTGDGAATPRDEAAAPALQAASLERWLRNPARAGDRRARAAVQAAALPPTRTFCVYDFSQPTSKLIFSTWVRKSAALLHESAHAAYYATADVSAGIQALASPTGLRPDLWTTLDSYFEGTVSPKNLAGEKGILRAVTSDFGALTDFDANGKVIFLFANLRATKLSSASFVAGYFDPNDVQAADETTGCTASGDARGANGADMLYLMDPVTYSGLGYQVSTVVDAELPAVMAHELQHDVLFNARCYAGGIQRGCALSSNPATTGDLWLNEGLSMVAEDLAGFGLQTDSGRARVSAYLSCPGGDHTCHETASLTAWPTPGDPYGNYGAVHAFLRWHLDQQLKLGAEAGPAFLKKLVGAAVGAKAAVADASGLSFAEGSARFASATLFSGWTADPAPDLDYASGTAWSPFHAQVGWPTFHPLNGTLEAGMRTDGWWAYQTGVGSGGDVSLTVTSDAASRPTLVVARVKGTLGTP